MGGKVGMLLVTTEGNVLGQILRDVVGIELGKLGTTDGGIEEITAGTIVGIKVDNIDCCALT